MAISISLSVTQNSQSIADNTSNVTVKVNYSWTYGSFNRDSTTKYVKINGTKYSFNDKDLNPNATTSGSGTLYTKTLNIAHNSDGTGKVEVYAYVDTDVSSGVLTKETTKTLDTIPRASTVSATAAVVGNASTITISRKSSSFTHTLTYDIGGVTGTIATKTTSTSVKWTLPTTLYKVFTTSLSKSGTITCKTYTSGGSLVGTKTCSITAKLDSTKASTITATSALVGGDSVVEIERRSSTFKHTLTYAIGDVSGTIVTKGTGTAYEWTIPTSVYALLTTTLSKSGTITCKTYTSGGTLIGTKTATFYAKLDETKASTVSATAGVIGSTSTLTISRKYSGFKHTIAYSIGDLVGTIVQNTTAISYKWTIPTSFYALIPNGTSKSGTLVINTYTSGGALVGTKNATFTVNTSSATCAPTLSPTVTAGTDTQALTGDTTTLIKNYSTANIKFNAAARNSATIKSQKVTNSGKSRTTDGGITYVTSGSFVFTVTDSRGYTTNKTVTNKLVEYLKPTISVSHSNLTVEGALTLTLKGSFFNGSFGAVSNTLTPQYRYKKDGGSFSSWATITPTKDGNSYTASKSFTGFDYQATYTFETRVTDKLYTTNGATKAITGLPVFDWDKDDFNFNVATKHAKSATFANGRGVVGTTTDGVSKNMIWLSTNDNVIIGGGNAPPKNIYLTTNDGGYVYVSNDSGAGYYCLSGLVKAMSHSYEVSCDVTAGANYSAASATAWLVGNQVRVYMSATRNSTAAAGNVTNETVMTVSINHGGKIRDGFNISFSSANTGAGLFYTTNMSRTSSKLTFDIILTATVGSNSASFNSYFALPITLYLGEYN